MSDSDIEIIAELHSTDRETEVEHKENISEESSAVNEEKAQAGFEPTKQDPKKPVKSIKEGSSIVNEEKALAGFQPPKQVENIKEESSIINEGKAEAAFEPPKQMPKKQVKRGRKKDGRRTKYNPEGIHKGTQLDMCDCLNPNCPGCWFPCKKCSSTKCGHECRQNRRWEYENIHIEGTSINIKNPFKK